MKIAPLLIITTFILGMTTACGSNLDVDNAQDDSTNDIQSVSANCDINAAPKIVSRAQWGARAPRSRRPTHRPNRITIHHTVQSKRLAGAAAARDVQNTHMNGNGWADMGYHFLVDRDGTIYQGNPENLVGAHVARQNTGNLGIAMIGSFHQETLGEVQKQAVARLVRHLARKYNIAINRTNIKGHKERLATICPGNVDLNELVRLAANGPTCTPKQDNPTPPTTTYDPIEVYWARLGDGTYKLHALAGTRTARVEYYVDGFKIGASDRNKGSNFPDTYRFSSETNERFFEVRGFDANDTQISRGIGLIDVTDEVGVYIRQMGKNLFEVGLERAPDGVAGVELLVDDEFLLTDSVTGLKRTTRGAVRHNYSNLGVRHFKLTTYNADGSVRGALRRTFDLRGTGQKAQTPPPPTLPSTAQQFALEVLKAHQTKNLTLWDETFGRQDGADPLSNITDASKGRAVRRSIHGTAPGGTVTLKRPLLEAMYKLRTQYKMSYFVTSIAGASHSANSLHYQGRAIDIDEVNGVRILGDSPQARAFMAACREMGAIEVFGPSNDPRGHNDHIHCAW